VTRASCEKRDLGGDRLVAGLRGYGAEGVGDGATVAANVQENANNFLRRVAI